MHHDVQNFVSENVNETCTNRDEEGRGSRWLRGDGNTCLTSQAGFTSSEQIESLLVSRGCFVLVCMRWMRKLLVLVSLFLPSDVRVFPLGCGSCFVTETSEGREWRTEQLPPSTHTQTQTQAHTQAHAKIEEINDLMIGSIPLSSGKRPRGKAILQKKTEHYHN